MLCFLLQHLQPVTYFRLQSPNTLSFVLFTILQLTRLFYSSVSVSFLVCACVYVYYLFSLPAFTSSHWINPCINGGETQVKWAGPQIKSLCSLSTSASVNSNKQPPDKFTYYHLYTLYAAPVRRQNLPGYVGYVETCCFNVNWKWSKVKSCYKISVCSVLLVLCLNVPQRM